MNIKNLSFAFGKIVFICFFLSACDNEKNKNSFSIKQPQQVYTNITTLKGKVRNKISAFNAGTIKVTDNKNHLVATTQLNKSGHYSVEVPAGTKLPVTLSFYKNAKISEKDKLISVAIYTSIKKYDINELTTIIAKKAKALGGYSHSNMVLAADSTVGVPDANKTSTGFRGDPTKQYGGWH